MAKKNEYEKMAEKKEQEKIIQEKEQEKTIQEDVENLEENIEKPSADSNLEAEIEEYKMSIARLQADFMNYKKRTEKEKLGLIKYGIETFVCELLPILDNFQRAIEIETNQDDEFFKGVKMIETQIVELLKKNGVEEIISLDEEFDPNCHHAIVQEEIEGLDENIVTGVLQKGYRLDDKVIRVSMVKVSK